jgi:SAM-dependent methyltransferase
MLGRTFKQSHQELEMNNSLRQMLKKIIRRKDYIKIDGSIIPSPDNRWCGAAFKNDQFYLQSAEEEALRLVSKFKCTSQSRVLDVGCGQGRLAIGLLRIIGELEYLGLDIDKSSIEWCQRYIERFHPTYRFQHLDLYNERYNKNGIKIDDNFHFDIENDAFDIIYLYSVFSHTPEEDMRTYLREFYRILTQKGFVFFTTFIEENVPNFSINPENYRLECSGPLHIVRYNKDYLFNLVEEYGFTVFDFSYASETDGQSAIYLRKTT